MIRGAAVLALALGLPLPALASRPDPARPLVPDLSVAEVYPKDFGALVSVANAGSGSAAACGVTLSVYDGRGQTLWQETTSLKPLSPGASEQVLFTAGRRPWSGMRFDVVVDSGNVVKERSETNNRSRAMQAPAGPAADRGGSTGDEPRKPSGSTTVDLAAINVFPAADGINGVIRNVGGEAYAGDRQATITLFRNEDGKESKQVLGTQRVPTLAAGSQQFVVFPTPPGFAKLRGYRLTLALSGGDGNPANDAKAHTSAGFSAEAGSESADLEASDVARILEGGVARIKGVVSNVSEQGYRGTREVRLYFIDQSGSREESTLVVSETVEDLAAGAQWEIVGDLPSGLRKVRRFTLRLSIGGGDDNGENDEKTRPFGNL